MNNPDNHDDLNRQKARAMLEEIGTVMLVTHEPGGGLHARPMQVLGIEHDVVWFFSDAKSSKTMEIGRDHDVLLAASCPERGEYVSVQGRARVVQDEDKQRRLWTDEARRWFPDGTRSEELALIGVRMRNAEFWASEASGGAYSYSYIQRMHDAAGQHEGDHEKVGF